MVMIDCCCGTASSKFLLQQIHLQIFPANPEQLPLLLH
jgi:hypothetical protein